MFSNISEFIREKFGLITFAFIIISVSLLFTMGLVRGQCISKGYEISKLAEQVEQKRIEMERVEDARSKILSKDSLFSLADDRGFIMMVGGKTFNIQ